MLQGIGAGFVPDVLDTGIYDEIIPVTDEDAFSVSLADRPEARGCWWASPPGAALWAAIEVARRREFEGKTVVALLPDTGDRYLSTPLFAQDP